MRPKALLHRITSFLLFLCLLAATWYYFASEMQRQTVASLIARTVPPLRSVLKQTAPGTLGDELQTSGFELGRPVLLRIYKQEGELEVWIARHVQYELFKTYQICKWSGQLGPKLKEGDGQSPEGFYEVTAKQLNPNSRYHLAMNIGFPNAFDQSLSRTGSALMIHGSCVSIGCYAMTDAGVEEIYMMVENALLSSRQSIPVHIFPFRMTDENLKTQSSHLWGSFWQNLAEGDALFQKTKTAPKVWGCGGRYYFDKAPENCESVRGW